MFSILCTYVLFPVVYWLYYVWRHWTKWCIYSSSAMPILNKQPPPKKSRCIRHTVTSTYSMHMWHCQRELKLYCIMMWISWTCENLTCILSVCSQSFSSAEIHTYGTRLRRPLMLILVCSCSGGVQPQRGDIVSVSTFRMRRNVFLLSLSVEAGTKQEQ